MSDEKNLDILNQRRAENSYLSEIEKKQHFIKEEKKESYFSGISKIWKKSRKLPKDLGLVSKQIKRYIDLEIGKYDANAKPAEKENVLLEMMPVRQISIKKESAGEP